MYVCFALDARQPAPCRKRGYFLRISVKGAALLHIVKSGVVDGTAIGHTAAR